MSTDPVTATDRRIWPDELAFGEDVYASRIEQFQAAMKADGHDAVLIFDPENMFWLTGYQTIGYFTFQTMIVPRDGRPTIVTRIVNRDMAHAMPTISKAIGVLDTEDHIDVLARVLNATDAQSIGFEATSRYLSVQDFQTLAPKLSARFTAWRAPIERLRAVKSEAQIDRMRAAARAVEAGMEAAIGTVAEGRTDNDVAAALYHGSIAAGSEYIGHPPMVVSGKRSALCFALWKRKVIERGDVVLLEGAGCVDRYHVMMSRSVVVGPPTDEQKATAEALTEVLTTAVDTIRPGLTSGEIDHACRARVERLGLGKYFKSRTAYGIGIGFPPNWAEGHIYAIRPDDPMVVEENMTFHIIPTMFREEFGMAISDSVRVTATGCEVLTQYPRDLVVKD